MEGLGSLDLTFKFSIEVVMYSLTLGAGNSSCQETVALFSLHINVHFV